MAVAAAPLEMAVELLVLVVGENVAHDLPALPAVFGESFAELVDLFLGEVKPALQHRQPAAAPSGSS